MPIILDVNIQDVPSEAPSEAPTELYRPSSVPSLSDFFGTVEGPCIQANANEYYSTNEGPGANVCGSTEITANVTVTNGVTSCVRGETVMLRRECHCGRL